MSLDELTVVRDEAIDFEAARARRAECADAMKVLEDAAASPLPGREQAWRVGVEQALIDLRAAFGEHIVITETKGGLFEEVTAGAPRLIWQTKHLTEDHAHLRHEIQDAIDLFDHRGVVGVLELRELVLRLLMHLSRHRQAASDLVYEAFEVDLGSAGD